MLRILNLLSSLFRTEPSLGLWNKRAPLWSFLTSLVVNHRPEVLANHSQQIISSDTTSQRFPAIGQANQASTHRSDLRYTYAVITSTSISFQSLEVVRPERYALVLVILNVSTIFSIILLYHLLGILLCPDPTFCIKPVFLSGCALLCSSFKVNTLTAVHQ